MKQFDYKESIAQRKATAEKQAREYFANRKERNSFFIFSGPSDLEGDDMLLHNIDPTPRYLYSMSLFYWDSSDEKLSERIHFRVELSHEEYLYLLTEQLVRTNGFSYNDLVVERPELTQKIQKEIKALTFKGLVPSKHYPFLVIFDEVLADATRIIESDL